MFWWMEGLTVLVVADAVDVAQNLNLAFRRYPSITVLGPAFDSSAAHHALVEGDVDVVVVDLDRHDDLGLALIQSLRASAPVPVLAMSLNVSAATTADVLGAGGSGLLPRIEEPRRMAQILRVAAIGEIALPEGHLSSVVEHLHAVRAERQRVAVASLTPREKEVLTLLCEGRSSGEVADDLGISGSTVQAHIKAVFAKLGVHSQIEAVRAGWRSGIGVPVSA